MNLRQLAEKCGKSPPFVMTLQKSFGLPVDKTYSSGYSVLLSKLIRLPIAPVPRKDIQTRLSREHKLLELLKVDGLARLRQEIPVLSTTLKWCRKVSG